MFDVAGHETTAGSGLLKRRLLKCDCAILKLASINGLVTMDKTYISELALSGFDFKPDYSYPSLC